MKKHVALIVGIIFFFVGVVILTGDFFVTNGVVSFLKSSIISEGKVTDIVKSRSDKGQYMYSPEVSFTDPDGKVFSFTSNLSTNSPNYTVGETVSILYNKSNHQDAKINTFFQLWFGTMILSILGIVFFVIGLSILIYKIINRVKVKELLANGTKISAKVISVKTNESYQGPVTLNGTSSFSHNPSQEQSFTIVAQWLSSQDNQMYVFESEDLGYNPESIILGKNIDVYIDPVNPKKYYVDISTLPKLAN